MSLQEQIDILKKKIKEQKKLLELAIALLELAKNSFKLQLKYKIALAKSETIQELTKLIFEETIEPIKTHEKQKKSRKKLDKNTEFWAEQTKIPGHPE